MFWSEGNEDSDSMFNELVVIRAEHKKSAAELLQLYWSLAAPPARPYFRYLIPVAALNQVYLCVHQTWTLWTFDTTTLVPLHEVACAAMRSQTTYMSMAELVLT